MSERFDSLNEREKQALRLLATGHDAKSIALHLGLSVHTINERLRDVRRKLGVSSSREAARLLASHELGTPKKVGDKQLGVAAVSAAPLAARKPAATPRIVVLLGGGVLIMALLLAVTLWSAPPMSEPASSTTAQAAATVIAESEGSRAARRWVMLLDHQRWNESWRASGALFRAQITSVDWATTIQPIRRPLGAVIARQLQSITRTTTLPKAPAGEYEVIAFRTRFAAKTEAVETVVLRHEGANWKVNGYFIR